MFYQAHKVQKVIQVIIICVESYHNWVTTGRRLFLHTYEVSRFLSMSVCWFWILKKLYDSDVPIWSAIYHLPLPLFWNSLAWFIDDFSSSYLLMISPHLSNVYILKLDWVRCLFSLATTFLIQSNSKHSLIFFFRMKFQT